MNKKSERYSWVHTHQELVKFLAKGKDNQQELINLLQTVGITGFDDKDESGQLELNEIDPFTFFFYLYKYGSERRLKNLQKIAEQVSIRPIPKDDSGIPSAYAQNVWLFPYKRERNNNEISRLWDFFFSALDDSITNEQFQDVLEIRGTGKAKITEALFIVEPEKYFPLNGPAKRYLKGHLGIDPNFNTYTEYLDILKEIRTKTDKPFYELSHEAWKWNSERDKINYWIFQGNPEVFNVIDAIADGALRTWSVRAYKDEINKGDKVIFWVTGMKPGCYALCEITSDVYEGQDNEGHRNYYTERSAQEIDKTRVNLKITHNLAENPITKEELDGIDELSELKVGHQGTNFSATEEEYTKLLEMVENRMEKEDRQNFPLNTIFYGPPGTGKTYNAVFRAAQIVENKMISDYPQAQEILKENLGDRIEFITFHQNYSYEDFIQGLRPDVDHGTQLNFERRDGVFKRISDRAYKNLMDSKKPGEAKKDFEGVFREFIEPLRRGEVDRLEVPMQRVSFWITGVTQKSIEFQKSAGESEHTLSKETLRKMYERGANDIIAGGLQPYYDPLLRILIEKGKKEDGEEIRAQNYVIIIDEINRANISRVFGELITLIEQDKRYGGSIPLKTTLPSGERFIVPSNLYIIGTMNTADKSIALLDVALRRRFEFEAMYPLYEVEGHEINDVDILRKINERIKVLKGHDFQIGHSYFMGDDLIERMNNKVIPLLLEYFMNDEQEVRDILKNAGLGVEEDSWPIKISGRK